MAYYNIVKRPRRAAPSAIAASWGGGKHLHRETRIFSKLGLAKTWGGRRALELEENDVSSSDEAAGVILREIIARYTKDPNLDCKGGKTKRYVLVTLAHGP